MTLGTEGDGVATPVGGGGVWGEDMSEDFVQIKFSTTRFFLTRLAYVSTLITLVPCG